MSATQFLYMLPNSFTIISNILESSLPPKKEEDLPNSKVSQQSPSVTELTLIGGLVVAFILIVIAGVVILILYRKRYLDIPRLISALNTNLIQ